MGLISWLKEKLGEDKAIKLLAILGGFFIYIVGNFPMAKIAEDVFSDPVYRGYVMLVWSGFVIAFSSIVILFFGKSEQFPIPAPTPLDTEEETAPVETIEVSNATIESYTSTDTSDPDADTASDSDVEPPVIL